MSTPRATARARAAAVLALMIPSSALTAGTAGAVVSNEGSAFKPPPMPQALYGIPSEPVEASVQAKDGTRLSLEYWRPVAKFPGIEPPSRLPVVVWYSLDSLTTRFLVPMAHAAGVPKERQSGRFIDLVDTLVPRGYAVVYAAQRGTGRSSGCIDDWSDVTADDGSRIVEWAGTRPWSTGSVGMYGQSNGAEGIWATALSDHRDRIKYLKAIIPMSGFASGYDAVFMDGAVNPMRNIGDSLVANGFGVAPPTRTEHLGDRVCGANQVVDSTENSGDFTPYWKAREHRDGLANLRAATLVAQGLFDPNVVTRFYMGLLDQWPENIPLKTLLGIYGHSSPDQAEFNSDGRRKDWLHMVTAWYDRWLKGLHTGVEAWPDVQVQDAKGQWREESQWVGGKRNGALALSAEDVPAAGFSIPGNSVNGVLGASRPQGETTFVQGQATGSRGIVSFSTPPLPDDLRIYGDPVLDLWLKVSDPTAKIGVRLDVIDDLGLVKAHPYASTYGARSMRHLKDFVDGRFEQKKGLDPVLNKPFRTIIRLNPTDMLVPQGWRLRLSFFSLTDANPRTGGGAFPFPSETTWTEGSGTKVTIMHDCDSEKQTVLRFATATKLAPLLNVWDSENTYDEVKTSAASQINSSVDGGGLATSQIC